MKLSGVKIPQIFEFMTVLTLYVVRTELAVNVFRVKMSETTLETQSKISRVLSTLKNRERFV